MSELSIRTANRQPHKSAVEKREPETSGRKLATGNWQLSRSAAGFTIVEILIVMAILAIVSSLAIIGTRQARVRTAEAAAISALRTINQAQFAFMQTCGNQSYAPTLVSLATPPPGTDSAFLSPDLTQSDPLQKSGYVFQMGGTVTPDPVPTCTGVEPLSGYYVTADPLTPGHSGHRSFGTNTDRVIYGDITTYSGNMPESGAPGHGLEIR
jgi:prepilin-type N-terminal cleavage/methylation domain-containing protein